MSGTVTAFDVINAYGYSMAKYLKRQSHNETLLPLTILYSNRTNEVQKGREGFN